MKKIICILLVLVCVLPLGGCGKETYFSGMAVRHDKEQDLLYVETDQFMYAFSIDTNTKFVWEDERMLEYYSRYQDGKYPDFWLTLPVQIVAGKENTSAVTEGAVACYHAKKITITQSYDDYTEFTEALKPVICLYPETRTEVTVQLDYDGELTCTYPAYQNGWSVTAEPDGTLTDGSGQTYNYLYWEGNSNAEYDFSQGFCVAGKDTAAFLEKALAQLGLTRREANEFIVYWLPLMEGNAYNLIAFQDEAYTDHAQLSISPTPDTLIRVFMAWRPLEEAVEIEPQTLTAPLREGFTAVEWGGARVD